MNLERLFNARSIAIIGASRTKGKVGYSIVDNMKRAGYKGKIYPINPNAKRILGLPCFVSVSAVKNAVDVAVLVVPAPLVPEMLRECGKKKIPYAVIISSGFKEVGPDGAKLEHEIQHIAKKFGISIVGPNCLGYVNTHSRINASFANGYPMKGDVAFISQSGAMVVSLIDWSLMQGLGLSSLVSLGNESGASEVDMIEYLVKDRQTRVIGMYLEHISDVPRFLRVVSKISHRKPIVALLVGKSQAGTRAIGSHTGSLASPYNVLSAVLRQAGVVQVEDLEDLYNSLKVFSLAPRNASKDIVIVTNAGGPGIIAVDTLMQTSLRMAVIPDALQKRLRAILPLGSAVLNPIDLVGDADFPRFKKALDLIIADPTMHTICILVTPQTMTPLLELAEYLGALVHKTSKVIFTCFIGGVSVKKARERLKDLGVLQFSYPYDALRIVAIAKNFKKEHEVYTYTGPLHPVKGVMHQMSYASVQKLLIREHFPIQKGLLATKSVELGRVHYPIAMKVLSPDIVHKRDAGAVALNLTNKKEADVVWDRFKREFKSKQVDGILIQPMVRAGAEFIIGMKRDALAGPVLMVGIGGSDAEFIHDMSLRVAPITRSMAQQMLSDLRYQKRLKNVDKDFLIRILLRLSALSLRRTDIQELDFNPVTVYAKGGIIVDARIVI